LTGLRPADAWARSSGVSFIVGTIDFSKVQTQSRSLNAS
jgi:hypothetical protein